MRRHTAEIEEGNMQKTEETPKSKYRVTAMYTAFLCVWTMYAFHSQSHIMTNVDGTVTTSLKLKGVDAERSRELVDDSLDQANALQLDDDDLDPMSAPNLLDGTTNPVDETIDMVDDTSWMTAEHLKLSSVSSRKYSTEPNTEFCKRLSPQGVNKAPIRIFIYQKGGGEQLVNILIHYLQALTYDEIVVIANEERDDDILSDYLYRDIVDKGIHFWQCSGSLTKKGPRWTEVMQQYQNYTEFLLPIDADEYLSIASPESAEVPHLIWNRPALQTALKALPPSGGKPYKTLDAKPVPVDCKNHPDADPVVPLFQKKHFSKFCAVPGISKGNLNCFAKNIFDSKEFESVDNGNHHGTKKKQKELRTKCENEGLESVYIPTNFVLVHYQVLQYSDWFLHLIKRVVDYKYMDCNDPNPSWPYFHVCNLYAKGLETNFSVNELTPLYEDLFCNNLRAYYQIDTMTPLSC